MSSAPSPATSSRPPGAIGSMPSFFSRTSDFRTASRATARCSGAPSNSYWPDSSRSDGLPASNRPSLPLTRRILRHRIVDPGHRDRARLGARQQVFVDRLPRVGRHVHVDPGHQRLRAAFIGAAGDLAVGIPVGDDEAAEIHPVFQHAGDQRLVAGHLHALPAGKADHHGRHTFGNRRAVRLAVNIAQIFFADRAVALIDPVIGAAIGEEMLGRCDHVGPGEQIVIARADPAGREPSRRHRKRPDRDRTNSLRRRGPSGNPAARPRSAQRSIPAR